MSRRLQIGLHGAIAVGATASALLLLPAAASAGSGGVFAGGASADGARVGVAVNDFVLVSQIVDTSGPAAQAVVDGFGTSKGYAAIPYPGAIALTAHGQTGGVAPVYPLIAYSSHPSRAKDANSGSAYSMVSRSDADASSAEAVGGSTTGDIVLGRSRSTADVRHDPRDESVVAEADTEVESLSFAGVLRIGRIHSQVRLVAEPGAPLRRTTRTEVGQVTVAGQTVQVTPAGLVLPGSTVPLPPDSTVNAILKDAGIEIHYVSGRVSETQTISDAVSVSVRQAVPGTEGAVVTYTIGTASAYAETGGTAPQPAGPSTDLAGFPYASQAGGAGTAAAADPVAAAAGDDGTGRVAAAPPGAEAGPAGRPPDVAVRAADATSGYQSSASFYAVLVLSAVALGASGQLFRLLAVRLAWT